jgi:hypothetical protein
MLGSRLGKCDNKQALIKSKFLSSIELLVISISIVPVKGMNVL